MNLEIKIDKKDFGETYLFFFVAESDSKIIILVGFQDNGAPFRVQYLSLLNL